MDIAEKTLQLKQDFDDVYEAGKKSQYDEFWDDYQQNGNRTNYTFAFSGAGWTKDNLNPKYKVVPLNNAQGGSQMFDRCNMNGSEPIDFSLIADKFDFSNIEYGYNLFYSAKIENIIADLSKATSLGGAFTNGWGVYNTKNITIKVNENVPMTNTFTALIENLFFMEGSKIGKSITVNSKLLTKTSILSIVEHLTTTASGQTVTLSKTAKEKAFTDSEWSTLIATKSNWTFSLV